MEQPGEPNCTDRRAWYQRLPERFHGSRRSIQAKLLFGIVTLSAMTVILAVTGLLGFYRYKSLAAAISLRATELPLATKLSREAAIAEGTNLRLCRYWAQTHQGMIDSALLMPTSIELEQELFDQTLVNLRLVADQYCDRIRLEEDCASDAVCPLGLLDPPSIETLSSRSQMVDGAGGALIDSATQRASLRAIRDIIADLERLRLDPRSLVISAGREQNDISAPLHHLVAMTQQHLSLMHEQMAHFSDHVQGQHRAGFAIACFAVVIAVATTVSMIVFFQTTVIKPFRTLIVGSRLVADGQYENRITLGTQDELSELADAMNDMTARFLHESTEREKAYREVKAAQRHTERVCRDLDHQVKQRTRELVRNERLAGVGFLAAGFAHEINNPMATIAWSAEALESRVSDLMMLPPGSRLLDEETTTTLQENLQRIQSEAFRCKSITEKMLNFSRMGNVERASIDLVPLVRDVAEMVATVGKYRCKSLQVDVLDAEHSSSVIAYANSPEIRQVVLNLVTNAMECVAPDGQVVVAVFHEDGQAVVRVRDNGCGMTEEIRRHVFEPFFTRRRDGTGTGLGLSISSRIVSQHGGSLDADSAGEGLGSEFVMRLPVAPVTHDEVTVNSPTPWRWKHGQTVEAA